MQNANCSETIVVVLGRCQNAAGLLPWNSAELSLEFGRLTAILCEVFQSFAALMFGDVNRLSPSIRVMCSNKIRYSWRRRVLLTVFMNTHTEQSR